MNYQRGLAAAILLFLVGCNRPASYLFPVPTPPAVPPDQIYTTTKQINSIPVSAQGAFDFVWLVGGMTERASEFSQGGADFMTNFAAINGLSWRMAVVASNGVLQMGTNPIFDNTSLDPVNVFSSAISNVLSNYDGEQIFDPTVNFLSQNPSWVRPQAKLVLVISNDNPDESENYTTSDQMIAFLTGIKGSLSNVIVYGVFGSDDLNCQAGLTEDVSWTFAGSQFDTLIQATGGKVYSLCGPSFGSSLAQIGNDLQTQPTPPMGGIPLAVRPDPSSIVVTYEGQTLPSGPQASGGVWYYDYDDNTVNFYDLSFAQTGQSSVTITYKAMKAPAGS